MRIKQLVKHGNSRALVIDSWMLQAARLGKDSLFQISITPDAELLIQAVRSINPSFEESKKKVMTKYDKLFKSLADK